MPRKKPGSGNPEIDALVQQIMASGDPMGQLRSIMGHVAPSPFEFHENEAIEVPAAPQRPQLLTVRVELDGSEPPIWRRLELGGDLRLDRVHDHLQAAMGWANSHLHRFSAPNTEVHQGNYFVTEFDINEGDAGTSETDVRLDQVLRAKGEFIDYEYDFGDGWTHKIVVESIRDATKNDPEARCTDGANACPPEDVGGIGFWNDLAAALRKVDGPRHLPKEFKDYREWLPENTDPDAFDVDEVNAAIEHAGQFPVDWTPGGHPTVFASPFLLTVIRKCPPHATDLILSIADAASEAPTPTEAELTHALRPWQALLDAATPDGIALTKAGWMAPAACEKIWHESGLAWPYGKGNREQNTPELSKIRQVCSQGKLIRKHKDALVLTPLGRKAASDQTVLAKAAAESLVMCPDDFDHDVCTLTMLVLAAGFTESENSDALRRLDPLGDEIARLMSTLGWRVDTGPVERSDLGHAYYRLLKMLQAGSEGEGRNYGVPRGAGVRYLARLAVLAS